MLASTRWALLVAISVVALLGATAAQAGNGSVCVTASKLGLDARSRCSFKPKVAAEYIIPPPPFRARVVSVRRLKLPPGEPVGRGPRFKRLYRVTFDVLHGNAVLPAGHRYSQFAYVTRKHLTAPWCFLKGGSGP